MIPIDEQDQKRRRATLGLRWVKGQGAMELVDSTGHAVRGGGQPGDPLIPAWTALECRLVQAAMGKAARTDGVFQDYKPTSTGNFRPLRSIDRALRAASARD